jgi:hypothetical protein
MATQRIYSPDGEPFDVPAHRDVSELLLNRDWSRNRPDPNAIPLVQSAQPVVQLFEEAGVAPEAYDHVEEDSDKLTDDLEADAAHDDAADDVQDVAADVSKRASRRPRAKLTDDAA